MAHFRLFKVFSIIILFVALQSCASKKDSKPQTQENQSAEQSSSVQEKSKPTDSLNKASAFVNYINEQHEWVDSTFNTLSPRERISQLIMVRAHSDLGQNYIDSVGQVIEDEKLGGVVVFQGDPKGHLDIINAYQERSELPLLISIDGEWGLGMRLIDSAISYPYQMTLGAVQDDELIYEMGQEIAKDLKRLGIHYNFAPDVDINNNPKNPVIGFRSFGDDKHNVLNKAEAYIKGMLDEDILSSIKHFPGHGDTDVDSHHDLPLLDFTRTRLDTLELYPFRKLIERGVPSVMVGHMHVPELDDTPNISSSVSPKIINDLLKEEYDYKGIVVTDAMGMQGVIKNYPDGEADVKTIESGTDLLELSQNSGRAIKKIEEAIEEGRLSQDDIDKKAKKVLATKYWLNLDDYQPQDSKNLKEDIHRKASLDLLKTLSEKAITVLNSRQNIEDFEDNAKTALIRIGSDKNQAFEEALEDKLKNLKIYELSEDLTPSKIKGIKEELRDFDQVVLAIHDNAPRPRVSLDLPSNTSDFLQEIAKEEVISVLFTSPYILDELPLQDSGSLIMGYQNDDFMQKAAARALLNAYKTSGKLPVNINDEYKNGQGL